MLSEDGLVTVFEILNGLLGEKENELNRAKAFWTKSKLEDDILALRHLLLLKCALSNEHICSLTSYTILWNCNTGIRSRVRQLRREPLDEDENSRVGQLVRHALQEHARRCRFRYGAKFASQLSQVDQTQLERMKRILSKFIEPLVNGAESSRMSEEEEEARVPRATEQEEAEKFSLAERIWLVFVNGACLPEEQRDWRRIYEGIKELQLEEEQQLGRNSTEASNFFFELNASDLRKSLDLHLLEPCAEYVDKLQHIFVPLEFDEPLLGKRIESVRQELDRVDFYYGWSHYRICNSLLANKENARANIKRQLERILKRAKNRGALI